jgi:putative peptidoglycan lipid II flippase
MTLSVFRFHMAGLLFIALNRILSPAFYAQSNTALPTAAGIFNFIINIVLAAMLVHPMGGPGIALALSAASFANTVFLFAAMPRLHTIDAGKIAKAAALYALKIVLFSAIASVPVYFVQPYLVAAFAGHNRLVSAGMPVLITACIFGTAGVALLVITRDPAAKAAVSRLSHRSSHTK